MNVGLGDRQRSSVVVLPASHVVVRNKESGVAVLVPLLNRFEFRRIVES